MEESDRRKTKFHGFFITKARAEGWPGGRLLERGGPEGLAAFLPVPDVHGMGSGPHHAPRVGRHARALIESPACRFRKLQGEIEREEAAPPPPPKEKEKKKRKAVPAGEQAPPASVGAGSGTSAAPKPAKVGCGALHGACCIGGERGEIRAGTHARWR